MPPPLDLLPTLLDGLKVTMLLTAGATLVAIAAAFSAGIARLSGNRLLRTITRIYIDVFRGTSALVQLFWVYFGLPLLGIELGAMTAGIAVLGLNIGAYGAEVVYGALQSVPAAQREAAVALNFTPWQTLWRILLPQAILPMLPPMGNLWIELLKGTALASMITLNEVVFQGQILRATTFRSTEIFSLILALYFLISLGMTFTMRGLERRLALGRDYGGVR